MGRDRGNKMTLFRNNSTPTQTHAFNPSTPEVEVVRSLSLRPVWTTELVPEQPSLVSESNHCKQKAGEDVIE